MALRWGIVSAGLIASDFTTMLSSLPPSEHQVVAVAARDLNRAKAFAQKHNIPKAYGSYEELAKDPDVEVAYVATQHPQHKSVVLLCLAAGKAVLCEKPMGVNAAEVREMAAEARSQGIFLMEALWSRFFPAMEALREVLVQGTVGNLRVARAEMGLDLNRLPRSRDWSQAGGGLLDLGIYCVQFLSMVFGAQKPEKISAVGRIHETGQSALHSEPQARHSYKVRSAPQINQNKTKLVTGEMDQKLRVIDALQEDLGSIPNTPMVVRICNSSTKGSETFL